MCLLYAWYGYVVCRPLGFTCICVQFAILQKSASTTTSMHNVAGLLGRFVWVAVVQQRVSLFQIEYFLSSIRTRFRVDVCFGLAANETEMERTGQNEAPNKINEANRINHNNCVY